MFFIKKNYALAISFMFLVSLVLIGCNDSTETKENDGLDYPNDQIEYIVGFDSGGTVDITARTMTKLLNEHNIVDESFIIENKPGGGSAVALQEVNKRKDDEHLLIGSYMIGDPVWTSDDLDISDYKPITSLLTSDVFIAVRDDSPYESINDVLEDLKDNPSQLNVGVPGSIQGIDAFYWDQIREESDIDKFNYVTSSGGAEDLNYLLGGQNDIIFAVPSVVSDYVEAEDIRLLTVLSEERSEYYPEVETLKEAAGIDVIYERNYGVWTGGDVSDEVVNFWYESFKEASEKEDWIEFMKDKKLSDDIKKPEEYLDYIITDGQKYEEYLEKIE